MTAEGIALVSGLGILLLNRRNPLIDAVALAGMVYALAHASGFMTVVW